MENKDEALKQIAFKVFGTADGIRPKFPRTGEPIQEAMELSYTAGREAERERIYDMATGQETKTSDKGNVWIRFNDKDWQALKPA